MSDDQGKQKCFCNNPDCYATTVFNCLERKAAFYKKCDDFFDRVAASKGSVKKDDSNNKRSENSNSNSDTVVLNLYNADSDSSKGKVKDTKGKPPVELIPWEAEKAMAEAFAFGAEKYGRDSFKVHGRNITELMGAAKRHIGKFLEGVDNDEESGYSHLGHAMSNLAMVLDVLKYHPEKDDRVKRKKPNE